jgi:hypothetical protein
MRNPHLIAKVLKGASIHPKLKMFVRRSSPIKNLEKQMSNMILTHGMGLGEGVKKARKPLKFNF